jgi:hypothetical protein
MPRARAAAVKNTRNAAADNFGLGLYKFANPAFLNSFHFFCDDVTSHDWGLGISDLRKAAYFNLIERGDPTNPISEASNPQSKGSRIGIKIESRPFTIVNTSAYYKFTRTTASVVAQSLIGFNIGCNINEQF